jgi:hypothetical protein
MYSSPFSIQYNQQTLPNLPNPAEHPFPHSPKKKAQDQIILRKEKEKKTARRGNTPPI